jgi:uncharacterized protein YoxC
MEDNRRTYIVRSPIRTGGKTYRPGDRIELTADEALQILEHILPTEGDEMDELVLGGDPGADDLLLQLDDVRTKLNLADEQLLQEKENNETLLQEKEKLTIDLATITTARDGLLQQKEYLAADLEEKTKEITALEGEKKTLADQVNGLQAEIAGLKKAATTPKKEGKQK